MRSPFSTASLRNSATPYTSSLTPVAMTTANAKALGFLGPDSAADATIHLNANAPFDFDPSDGTTAGQFDFVSVAAHELGHALGFVSAVGQMDQLGGAGLAAQVPSTVLDLFRYSAASLAAGPGFSDVTADARAKFFSVDGGATAVAQFATGAVYGTGYPADHWREFTFTGLMDPASFPGLPRRISVTDERAFDVLGYTLVPEPGAGVLLAFGLGIRQWLRRRPH